MIYAAIDVGSNTIRLLIGTVSGGRLSRIYTEQKITRLARGLRHSGMLSNENMQSSLSVLSGFAGKISEHGASSIRAVGTSAIREAKNSRQFIDMLLHVAGINIETITGQEEALLTAKGVLSGFDELKGEILIIDIGGGSTEWIVYNADDGPQNLHCGTVHVGVVNLYERFVSSDPPSTGDISALSKAIDSTFVYGSWGVNEDRPKFSSLIGTGGTITTLAAIDLGLRKYDHKRVHGYYISRERLVRMNDSLLRLTLKERMSIAGLEPERADLIIPGILLTIKLLDFFGFQGITVSDFGLLEGIIKEASDEKNL